MTSTPEKRLLLRWLLAAMLLPGPLHAQNLPEPARPLVALARAALARSDGIAAEVHLRQAMERGATREQVAARMGEALIDQGELRKARDWLGPARFAGPEELHGWRMIGLLERLEGSLPAAGRAYDRALVLAPKSAPLWVDIGRLRYVGGEQMQAVEAVDRALALDPADVRALEFRGQLVRDRYGLVAALPWFERAIALAPKDVGVLGEYAATLGELGRAKDMLAVTRRMLELEPGNPRAFYLQAVLAARANMPELARGLLNRTGGRLRDVPAVMLLDGALNLMVGNSAQAVELLDRLTRLQPGNERAHMLLARAMTQGGHSRELVQRFGPAAARGDASVYLLLQVGRAHEELGQREPAAPLLDRAARLSSPPILAIDQSEPLGLLALRWREAPRRAGTAVPYIRKLIDSGALAEAESVAERLRIDNPGANEAWSLAGDVQLVRGNAAAAAERYAVAAGVRFDEGLLLRLSDAYGRSGQAARAMPVIEGYLASHPQSRFAARLAAALAGMSGDWARALLLLEYLRDTGSARDARLMADLAYAQMKAGDNDAAIASARAAYALQLASAVSAQALGTTLAAAGRERGEAAALLDKARRIGGDNPMLEQARAMLRH